MRESVVLHPERIRKQAVGRKKEGKRPFEIGTVICKVREAIKPFAKAAMFELAERGYDSVFEQLVGCIISIRTLDEVTVPTAEKFFDEARTPEEVGKLSVERIDKLITPCTFHEGKARSIKTIATEALEKFGGRLPCDRDKLMELHGVGPKCANLVLGVACGQGFISVDIHVHRVTNRWGYVRTTTPEKTMVELQARLPKEYWIEINSLLVPFGKHICTGRTPKCFTCPVLDVCQQVGVTKHR